MQMHTDDEIYAVDDRFLGPSGHTTPWGAVRYRAYGVGAVIYGAILGLEMWTGILSPWNAVFGLVATVWLTFQIMDRVTHEMTVRALATTLVHEISAPRGRTTGPRIRRLALARLRRRQRQS